MDQATEPAARDQSPVMVPPVERVDPVELDRRVGADQTGYPLTIRIYRRNCAAIARLQRSVPGFLAPAIALVEASHSGFWLGVLERGTLHLIDRAYYDDTDQFLNDDFDYREADYNRRGLWAWEAEVMDRYFRGCDRLLVGSAGGGREVLALCRLGYQVEGFECNPLLVRCANEILKTEGVSASVRLAERDSIPEYDQPFDGAVVGWASYMHIQGRDRRIAYLRELQSRVREEGPVLLSFYFQSGRGWRLKVMRGVANTIRWLLRREPVEPGDGLGPTFEHLFTREQVEEELAEAGYQLLYYSTEEYGHAVCKPAS